MAGRPFQTRQGNVFAVPRDLVVMAMVVVQLEGLRDLVMRPFMRQMRMQAEDTPGQEDRADGYEKWSAHCHAKSITYEVRAAYAGVLRRLGPTSSPRYWPSSAV